MSLCSVCKNGITGEGAESLSAVVLEHPTLTMFCEIPLVSMRENTIKELNLNEKGIGVPGAIVLGKLLLSNSSIKSLECAHWPLVFPSPQMSMTCPATKCACFPHKSVSTH